MTKLTTGYIRKNVNPTEYQNCGFDPERILIYPTQLLDNIADEISVAQGNKPFFNHDNHGDWEECNHDGWYDFSVIVDNETDKVEKFFIEDSCSNYIGEIELDEECNKALMENIWNYYGGKNSYKEFVKQYNS